MNAELTFLNALQALRTPALDGVMRFFTHLGDSGFVWLALTALLLAFRRTRRAGWVLAAALLFDAVLCNILLKPLAGRIRPCDILTEVELLIPRPEDFSFPSGHTAASFASVTALWLAGKKRWAMAALPLAVLIAFSRMYLCVHFPTDILGGAVLGTACGWLGAWAIKKLEEKPGLFICNLGTGHGYSVLDVIHAFSKACGKELPYVIDPRRPGDIAECWCDPSKAKRELGWEAEYGIDEMCRDSWNWQSHNPDGYKTAE